MINTVLGEIAPEELGTTYIHEHLYVAPDELERYYSYTLDIPAKSVEEARSFKDAGGKTIVDMTPLAYGRNPEALREISRAADINIICVTGFHKDLWLPRWFDQLSDSEVRSEITREIVDGIGYSKVHPGAIKIGTSLNEVTDRERRSISLVAPLAQEFKLPMITHCDKGTMGEEQIKLIRRAGMDLEHVCLSHTDLTVDVNYMKRLIDSGVSLSIDHIGRDLKGHDHERVAIISELVKSGYEDQLCLAGDMGKKDYFKAYGGKPGLSYILTDLRKYLLEEIDEKAFEKMVEDNPRRVLSWE